MTAVAGRAFAFTPTTRQFNLQADSQVYCVPINRSGLRPFDEVTIAAGL